MTKTGYPNEKAEMVDASRSATVPVLKMIQREQMTVLSLTQRQQSAAQSLERSQEAPPGSRNLPSATSNRLPGTDQGVMSMFRGPSDELAAGLASSSTRSMHVVACKESYASQLQGIPAFYYGIHQTGLSYSSKEPFLRVCSMDILVNSINSWLEIMVTFCRRAVG